MLWIRIRSDPHKSAGSGWIRINLPDSDRNQLPGHTDSDPDRLKFQANDIVDVVYLGRQIALSHMSPNAGGGGSCGVSANEYSCAQNGAQINFEDLTPYLSYDTVPQVCRKGEPFVDLLLLGNLPANRLSAHLNLQIKRKPSYFLYIFLVV